MVTENLNGIAFENPLRYRGYYYDSDTNLYYLQSRYYDANIGRFINSDEFVNIIFDKHALMSYCINNPINMIDKNGYRSYSATKIIKSSYTKKKYKVYNDYYIKPLTNYIETANGGTISWTTNHEFTVSFSLSTSVNAEFISAQIGVTYEETIERSQSYSFKLKKKKGKYARIVAKIPAQSYKVFVKVKKRTTYYSRFLFWTKAKKITETIITNQLGYVFVPIMEKVTIALQYSNKR